MTTYNSSLSVLMTYNTPSGTTKHCKSTEPESRQTAKIFSFPSSFLFFFLFFRWAGSKVQYATKRAAFLHWAARAPAHRFFTTLKSHKVVQTGHRSMGSFAIPLSSFVRMGTKQLLLKIAELETRSVCTEPEMGRVESMVEQMPCQWQVLCYHPYLISLLFADLLSLHLIFLMLFGLVCNTKWNILQYILTD